MGDGRWIELYVVRHCSGRDRPAVGPPPPTADRPPPNKAFRFAFSSASKSAERAGFVTAGSGATAASSVHRSPKYMRTRPSELSESNTVRQMNEPRAVLACAR